MKFSPSAELVRLDTALLRAIKRSDRLRTPEASERAGRALKAWRDRYVDEWASARKRQRANASRGRD